MKYSFFGYFFNKKYGFTLFIIDIRDIAGLFDFCDRLLFIILISTTLDLSFFICSYVFYRLCILYFYIKKKLSRQLEKESLYFDIYNKEKFCIGKKTIISDRPRCKYSVKESKSINSLYTFNSTVITKGPYL